MHVLICGGGGLGTVIAGLLADSGVEVTLLVKPGQAAPLTSQVISIEGLAQFSARVRVVDRIAVSDWYDYLLVCVKTRDTDAALTPLRDARIGTILSFQNGVRKDELLARIFGSERVLGALTGVGGTLLRPGEARYTLAGATLVGELKGGVSARGERLAMALREAGLAAACVPDILVHEWHKLALFLPSALVCSLSRLDAASSMLDPDLARLRARLASEVTAIAATEGQSIGHLPVWFASSTSSEQPMATLGQSEDTIAGEFQAQGQTLRNQGVRVFPSMATDIIAGRPTELEDTAGDLLQRAERHGVAVPLLRTCTTLLRGVEQSSR